MELGGRVVGDDLAARRLLLGLVVRRQVRADDLPGVAVVPRAEQHVAAVVHRLRVLRRQHDRGVPVEAVLLRRHPLAARPDAARVRVDAPRRARPAVRQADHAALQVVVDQLGVLEVGHAEEAVTAAHVLPLGPRGAGRAGRLARAAPGAVVLQAAAQVIRHLKVVRHVVELRERDVVEDVERPAGVVRDLEPAVVTEQDAVRIGGIDPHRLVIAVRGRADAREVPAAVLGLVQAARQRVHRVRVLRVHADVGVVERPEVDVAVAAHRLPRRARVLRSPQFPLVGRLADHVHDARIAARHGDADAIHQPLRQAAIRVGAGQPRPGGAAVERLVDGCFPAARLRVPGPAAEGEHARVDDVRVGGVDVHVRATGEVVPVEDPLPALAAVNGLEEAALLVRAPLAAQRARVDDVGVAGIDDEARDLLAVGKAHVRPVLTGVDRFVHAVADRRVVARVALAGAGVDHVGIRRRDGDRPDGGDRLIVEDRLPRDAAVGGLEDAAHRARHVHRGDVAWQAHEHRDPPGLGRRSDIAPLERRERAGRGRRGGGRPLGREARRLHRYDAGRQQRGQQEPLHVSRAHGCRHGCTPFFRSTGAPAAAPASRPFRIFSDTGRTEPCRAPGGISNSAPSAVHVLRSRDRAPSNRCRV